jgi:GH43 family beta-xylosidase
MGGTGPTLLAALLALVLAPGAAASETAVSNPIKPLEVPVENPTVGTYTGTGADPWIRFEGGRYVLTYTVGTHLEVRTAETIGELTDARPTRVWPLGDEPENRDSDFWAPELHRLRGPDGAFHWYLYYAAAPGTDGPPTTDDDGTPTFALDHRMHVLESVGDDPRGPYRYRGTPWGDYGIDMTVHRTRSGRLVAIFAGHCVEGQTPAFGCQSLYLAGMRDPWTFAGPPIRIADPTLPWEVFGQPINEGPLVIERGRSLHVVFSASFFATDEYKLGRLTVPVDADLTDPRTWRDAKHPEPIFTRTGDVYGPGHNGFFRSPDGREDWIVYHATDEPGTNAASFGGTRTARVQPFTWRADDTPDLGRPRSLGEPLPAPSGDPTLVRQAEYAPAEASGAERATQTDLAAVGRRASRLDADGAGDRISHRVDVPRAGRHVVALRLRFGPQAPVVRATAGGEATTIDLRRPAERYDEVELGPRTLGAGRQPVTLEVVSGSGPVLLDQVRLELEPRGALGLPAPRAACRSRRTLSIRLRAPRGERLRIARVYVGGRRVRTLRGARPRVPVSLAGLPSGRYRVRVVARTTRGRTLRAERVYRTCTPRRR